MSKGRGNSTDKKAGGGARRVLRRLGYVGLALLLIALAGSGGGAYALYRFGRDLPDYSQLAVYEPPVTTRVHASDGSMLAEYARQRRVFVPISAVPKRLIQAMLSAEDKKFYSHQGIDYLGIVRAVLVNVKNVVSGRRPVGASTITQQVAKNFLLTNEVSYRRKIQEAILAFRIEHAFTKDQILELYLNEIYLGMGSYGVAAAALNYFNKSLDELTLAEAAYLAALPKGPNNYHPVRHTNAAIARRNWVIGRMHEEGFVDKREVEAARAEPLTTRRRDSTRFVNADHFNEEVRRRLYDLYGAKQLYEGGLSVRTSLDPRLQAIAEHALRDGLTAYDRRHGWRGPLDRISLDDNWLEKLNELKIRLGPESWRVAAVLDVDEEGAFIGFKDGGTGHIPFSEMKWARAWREKETLGPKISKPSEALSGGDIVAVELIAEKSSSAGEVKQYGLRQAPAVDGAVVALDPHTGRILAMAGGFDFGASQFNRATQALRQPGSAFKPIVYAAALDQGFTPSSLVLDAPFVIDQGYGLGKWKPSNSSNKFYGPSTLRLGIEKSRNLMTVRLAQYVGIGRVINYAKRFEVVDNMPPILSMALGAGETTLLRMTTAYAMFANGGKRVTPSLIDRIQDRHGKTVFRQDRRECQECATLDWISGTVPQLPDVREQVLDKRTAYQVVSMLQGVVERGTGRRIRAVGKPLAGKTGTSNDAVDTWFIGFAPDLALGVFVGFDQPRPLGRHEEGSSVAVPIFRDFMKEALKGQPAVPFRIPAGIRLVRVNATTGLPAAPGDRKVILEAFKPGTEPTGNRMVLDGSEDVIQVKANTRQGTGGLY
ncbi:MAG: penicillin-binding protein 1A [Sphingomonadales bacterium]